MNKRMIVGSLVLIPAIVFGGGKLPDWAEAKIGEAVARYQAWKGTNETVAFTFMTDVHSRLADTNAAPNFANSRYHVLFAEAAADRAGCDFLVDAGDHDFEHQCPTAEEAFKRMALVRQLYASCTARPVLFCLGNHDHGPFLKDRSVRPISSAQFGDALNSLAEQHGFKTVFGENRSWGYCDIPGKKFRAIFCNTSDEGYYGFSQSQVDFVELSLKSLPEGWTAAAFSHYCVFDEIGHWKRYQRGGIKRKKEFMAVLEKFAQSRPHAFVGIFCGDSHFDNEQELRGVNWTVSQGYGGVSAADKPWGARTIGFSRNKDMLFELVAVKPQTGECRIFRVGAGGAAFDRGYLYFNEAPIE